MKKLPNNLDDPMDNIFSYISDLFSPPCKKIGMTPNSITTISLIFGVLAIYYMIIANYQLAAIFYLIAYFFDVMDGYYARKYNMETEFGDYYDHFADMFKNGVILIILIYLLYIHGKYEYILLIVILGIISMIQLGAQEKYLDSISSTHQKSSTLSNFKSLCFANDKESIENILKYTRFSGVGITVVIISIIIFNLDAILK
ncbi:MAG: CDP-alcohol phosphatidyltransferase [Edafosvirus sp.]|uniref:CDP-alcohol phosphatidyltransferase n=1 Tax=Edafosvirus sp. TaxID=2487765 RepID=A0A3G4ZWK3_9VIRU|nr:MAG: CDP-alcohol phosphatidyltransferase [Edafosvirus sp.]